MKILNTEKEDYHVHSLNFSDGFNTVDEIVKFAGKIGMKKIVICDHSRVAMDIAKIHKKTWRSTICNWKNVHNNVEVKFGVEADLLNENGDICDQVQNVKEEFIILSYHPFIYKGDKKKVTQAFICAIEKHHKIINIIGHLYAFSEDIDILAVVEAANKYNIPLELNCKYLDQSHDDVKRAKLMLSKAKAIYINSDAHTLADLRDSRKQGIEFLKKEDYIK